MTDLAESIAVESTVGVHAVDAPGGADAQGSSADRDPSADAVSSAETDDTADVSAAPAAARKRDNGYVKVGRLPISRRNIRPAVLDAPPDGADVVPVPVRNASPHLRQGGYDKATEYEATDTSWFRGGLRDGVRAGRVSMLAVHRAIVVAAAHALRNGVDLERLDGLSSWQASHDGLTVIDTRANRLVDLKARLGAATRAAASAREQERAAREAGSDDDTLALFAADALELTRKAAKLQAELRSLAEQTPADDEVTPAAAVQGLRTEGALIAKALTALWAAPRMSDTDQTHAVRSIIEGPYLWPDGLHVHGRFSLLLPADGGVIRLGPMFFTLPNESASASEVVSLRLRNTPSSTLGAATLQGATKQPARRRLGGDVTPEARSGHEVLMRAGLSKKAAWVVTLVPFPELRQVLLADLNGTRLPDVADERWLDPVWREHLRQTYAAPGFAWLTNRHSVLSWVRQMLADTCHTNGGELSREELTEVLVGYEFHHTTVHGLTNPAGTTKENGSSRQPWLPSVERVGNWRKVGTKESLGGVVTVRCRHCGEPATRVVRTPETAEGLLCDVCGMLPRSELLVPPPHAYGLLALTNPEWQLLGEERRLLARERPAPGDPGATDPKAAEE